MDIIPRPTFSPQSEGNEEMLGPPAASAPLPGEGTHLHQSLAAGVPVSSWNFFHLLIAGDSHSTRRSVQTIALENLELFIPRFDVPLSTQRELALRRLRTLCQAGLFSVFDFDRAPRRLLTMHECCGMLDASLATKFTVQFNLFGGTLLRLGSKENHVQREILNKIDTLEEIGCFALTELGYGNNAVCLETTATYEPARDEFVISSPTTLSQKYWITNGALHASWAIVFAQMIIRGASQGVHAFLVRIRQPSSNLGSSSELRVCPGVTIEDMGHRIGCNGVDNAKITFHNVRIPRSHLLDGITKVEADGRVFSIVDGPDSLSVDLETLLKKREEKTSDRSGNGGGKSAVSNVAEEKGVNSQRPSQKRRTTLANSAQWTRAEVNRGGQSWTGDALSSSQNEGQPNAVQVVSPVEKPEAEPPSASIARNRFLLQTEQLLSGRLCIACMMIGGIKVVLNNTLRYSSTRLSTGPSGLSDTPILSFAVQKQTLMPLLAQALILMAWTNEVKALYERFTRVLSRTASVRQAFLRERIALCAAVRKQRQFENAEKSTANRGERSREETTSPLTEEARGGKDGNPTLFNVHTQRNKKTGKLEDPVLIGSLPVRSLLEAHAAAHCEVLLHCCALKPTVAWCAERLATEGRERCGGGGFLSANLFGEFIGSAHAGLTAEGDNRVLYAKVSKEVFALSCQHNSPVWLKALAEFPETSIRDEFAAFSRTLSTSGNDAPSRSQSPSFPPLFSVNLDPHLPVPPPPQEPSFPPPLECGPGATSSSEISSYPPPMYGPEGELLKLIHILLRLRMSRKIQRLRQLLQKKQTEQRVSNRDPRGPLHSQKRESEKSLHDHHQRLGGMTQVVHEQGKNMENTIRMQKKQMVYDLWMADVDTHDFIYSSAPASIAKCFADLAGFEAYLRLLGYMMQHKHELCAQALEAPLRLFGLSCLEADLGFMMAEKLIKPEEVHALHQAKNDSVDRVAAISMQLISCFGIPEKLLFAPIARDWEAFNDPSRPTNGELTRYHDSG
ncbi:acyl-CoA dehydrogenase, middle domain-containing protein [Toxoplasma gondii GT1]|uniref:Acyl-CoA dehydrogenase, middle domain-containing protein n=3 Tax=Toxoplasma gondii TaxID=5811 RepID=S7W1J1_TOXGG|nr:acyl-CoA dehydrogenase, middle domain-containing protein [Toxoplasma gondii GT1]KAF4639661.1 acyl-CoA dehydrogenase, middle domain-containing protein [Toxoplasma gondii]